MSLLYAIPSSIAVAVAVLGLILVVSGWEPGVQHRWVRGRNPYRRYCSVCGRHEEQMCWSMDSWNSWWWEVFDKGDETKHGSST